MNLREALNRNDAGSIVPPSGITAQLTLLTAAAMAVLCVFALTLSLAAQRIAQDWEDALAHSATVRINAPDEARSAERDAVMEVLLTTPGIAAAREITVDEQKTLLAPWLGEDAPIDMLNLPVLIAITQADPPYDATGLRLRLSAQAPSAVLDEHNRWRAPIVAAAQKLRLMGWGGIVLIGFAMAAMVILATTASLAANAPIIEVLRLIGATDRFIARAFVARFTLHAALGAGVGSALAAGVILSLPDGASVLGFANLALGGADWLWVALIPFAASAVAFAATQAAASIKLKGLT